MDTTGIVSFLFTYSFLVAFGWQFGWQPLVGLFVVTFLTGQVFSIAIPDSFAVWVASTFSIWPLMYFLGREVNWFGILG